MNILLSSRTLFLLGFIVIVATNILLFLGVAKNRTGEGQTHITLTERELSLGHNRNRENSGLNLQLNWRISTTTDIDTSIYSRWNSPDWFTGEKLELLGFNTTEILALESYGNRYKRPLPKEVYIVLEYNGEAYQKAVAGVEATLAREKLLLQTNSEDKTLRRNLERAEERLKNEMTAYSRLFAIDAGLSRKELHKIYPDQSRFFIIKGLVEPSYRRSSTTKDMEVGGVIPRLSTSSIHVSLEHRGLLDKILADEKHIRNLFHSPCYSVRLGFGSRQEPWIESVQSLENEGR